MPKKIEKDLEELSVNLFVNEYGALRAVYNRLYAIIHVYYSIRGQLVASEDTLPIEKILQMRKDIAIRLERINALTKDEQFPQENFEIFAREKLEKMHLAIGLLETASLMGELSSYSKTIKDYMRSCCEFASKFITVLSDPGNQNLKALRNNLATLLKQIDVAIKQSQSSDQGRVTVPLSGSLLGEKRRVTVPLSESLVGEKRRVTVPLSGSLSVSQMEGVSRSSSEGHLNLDPSYGYVHQGCQSASREGDPISNVNDALSILEKIDLFRSKSREVEANVNSSGISNDKDIGLSIDRNTQNNLGSLPNVVKFQEMLDEKYGFDSRANS